MPRHGVRRVARRVLPGVVVTAVLAGCGAPPKPLPTAPPGAGRLASSGMPAPSGGPTVGSVPPGGLPSGYPLPTYGGPVAGYPTPTTTPSQTPSPTRSLPPPAPVCRSGPTKQQMLDLVEGRPGIPDVPLEVRFGPYCAGSWQLAVVGIVGETADEEEQVLVVSTGQPASPQLVEAGADVCNDRVERDAPPGIRVLACGY